MEPGHRSIDAHATWAFSFCVKVNAASRVRWLQVEKWGVNFLICVARTRSHWERLAYFHLILILLILHFHIFTWFTSRTCQGGAHNEYVLVAIDDWKIAAINKRHGYSSIDFCGLIVCDWQSFLYLYLLSTNWSLYLLNLDWLANLDIARRRSRRVPAQT